MYLILKIIKFAHAEIRSLSPHKVEKKSERCIGPVTKPNPHLPKIYPTTLNFVNPTFEPILKPF